MRRTEISLGSADLTAGVSDSLPLSVTTEGGGTGHTLSTRAENALLQQYGMRSDDLNSSSVVI